MAPKKNATATDRAESSTRRVSQTLGPLPHTLAFYGLTIEHENFRERFVMLSRRGVATTYFVDRETLEALGVWYDISHLFHSISWGYVLSLDCL